MIVKKTYHFLFLLLLFGSNAAVKAQRVIHTDVLVVGGGASGIAAGIQASRLGVNTIIAEPTTWLGGMITAAGVAAFDGNHNMPSGIWAEFRNELYKVYGGPAKVATGWVSMTQFEPHVGDSIFKSLANKTRNLTIKYQYRFLSILQNKTGVKGAIFLDQSTNRRISIYAKQLIDATELGDVIKQSGAKYDVGMEASSISGENVQVDKTSNIIQDLTYTAILKDYGSGKDCTIAKPIGYNPEEFDGSCTNYYFNKSRIQPTVTAAKMLDYGRLPNNKFMINWPGYGNDIYLNIIELNDAERIQALEKAKQQTLRFIYFIQQQLGFKNLGIANDEFPTADHLPLIAYHREGRRVKGLVRFNINHIAKPYETDQALYRTGIAVGDYPIDHHHRKNPEAPQHLSFYPVPSYNIPLGALIPVSTKGLIAAEKAISVSNIVNGTTRLQPVVMLIGQAAGVLAAMAVKQKKTAADVSIRKVQEVLLNNGAYLMPYFDVPISNTHFAAVQRIGATGILKGKGVPHNWANQTWFYPDSLVNATAFANDMAPFTGKISTAEQSTLSIKEAIQLVVNYKKEHKNNAVLSEWKLNSGDDFIKQLTGKWSEWGFGLLDVSKSITRLQLAKLLDATIHPFEIKDVNHQGFFKSTYSPN